MILCIMPDEKIFRNDFATLCVIISQGYQQRSLCVLNSIDSLRNFFVKNERLLFLVCRLSTCENLNFWQFRTRKKQLFTAFVEINRSMITVRTVKIGKRNETFILKKVLISSAESVLQRSNIREGNA